MSVDFYGFRLKIPEGWQDESVLVLRAPGPSGQHHCNLVLTRRPAKGKDLRAAQHAAKKDLLNQRFESLKFDPDSMRKIGGWDAAQLSFTHDVVSSSVDPNAPEPVRVEFARKVFVIVKDDLEYRLTWTTLASEANRHAGELDELLGELQLP